MKRYIVCRIVKKLNPILYKHVDKCQCEKNVICIQNNDIKMTSVQNNKNNANPSKQDTEISKK